MIFALVLLTSTILGLMIRRVGGTVCIAIHGLSRSAAHTHKSFDQFILRPLRSHHIDYDVYFHTWLPVAATYNNFWSGEINVNLSTTDYLDMPANHLQVETEIPLDAIPYLLHGDPWEKSVRQRGGNESRQLEHIMYSLISLHRVTQMWKSNPMCKTVLVMRPDSLFLHELDVAWLATSEVLTPDFARWPINDRFAIGPAAKMITYGERWTEAKAYAQHHPLHTEEFLAHIFKINGWSTEQLIDFCFFRVRTNGLVVPEMGRSCETFVMNNRRTFSWVPAAFRPPQYRKL